MEEDSLEEIIKLLKQLENIHYPSGPIYSKNCKAKALFYLPENELEGIYHLVESHAPSLRLDAVQRYEKALELPDCIQTINKGHINFQCNTFSVEDKIHNMLLNVKEMPKEWTIIQLTSQFNIKQNLEVNPEQFYGNSLHVTVFNCGKCGASPFTVTLEPPIDKINGKVIEVTQEIHSILTDSEKCMNNFKAFLGKKIKTLGEKQAFMEARYLLNSRLQNLVNVVQNKWLKEWRCLFSGKLIDTKTGKLIISKIKKILRENDHDNLTEKQLSILKCLVKSSGKLNIMEIKEGLKHIFPDDSSKDVRISLGKVIKSLSEKYCLERQLKHPVILIVDEKLDIIPWEMVDILEDQPVSRMPSLHFTYALFKEHKDTIVNGYKEYTGSIKGTYLINPDLDLKNMETRLNNFFNYWLPEWSGIVGVKPSEEDFKTMLTDGDVFVYNGHGNGTQFFSSEKIPKIRINKVILLFGCSSVTLTTLGAQVEMYSSCLMYLIACSPCVVGMLWQVTDVDTDLVTTEFLSQWLKSTNAPTHWKLIDKKKWQVDGSFDSTPVEKTLSELDKHEPELLRALCKAKKVAKQYLTKCACVARGLPVKIQP